MNVLVIVAALASGVLCSSPVQLPTQLPTQQTVYIQESTAPPKIVTQHTSVSSPAAAAGQLSYSYPTTFTSSAKNFGSSKSISSFPAFGSTSRSYQWPASQQTYSKPATSYVTKPSYSATASPVYSTVYSTPRSWTFNSGVYSTPATPVSSYPTSYATPTVTTSYVTPTTAASYPAYSTSVSTTAAPFTKVYSTPAKVYSTPAKIYSTPATVTTTYPAASPFKNTLETNYVAQSNAWPLFFRDSSRPVVTQFSSPNLWTSQGTSRSFFSNGQEPITIQKSTTFAPVRPTVSAYADAVTLHPFSGQYNTAFKSLGSQYYSPATRVEGGTVYTKPTYNSYSAISSVPASWVSYPTAQAVQLPAAAAYSYSVPTALQGSQWTGTSHLSSSTYNALPTGFSYNVQGAPLTREYHTLETPHAHSWNTANSWSSLPAGNQVRVS